MSKIIGPTFGEELIAAGLANKVNSFTIGEGDESIYAPNLSPADRVTLDAVIAAHNPDAVSISAARDRNLAADAQVIEWAARLANATPAQIDTWFANNVTNAASAITVLKALAKILALKLR